MGLKTVVAWVAVALISVTSQAQTDWRHVVDERLLLMGHRNWIAVVDSAYPLQSAPGVETVETSADLLTVLDYVLGTIRNSSHVRPLVHTDVELLFVPESEAPGINQYREQLKARLSGIPADSILHQQLIDRLSGLGKDFHVLILKTNMMLPYTSVFVQLDCKYWNAQQEALLRARMKSPGHLNSK